MCGICGILHYDPNRPVQEAEVRAMMAAIGHRGPDDRGWHMEQQIGIGHQRLSIIDLSVNGRQPMQNEEGTLWITYNGEFYNYAAFLSTLKAQGHVFRSLTDTEVILHLYEEVGLEETLRSMNGMFAFGLWDKTKGRLYLVRDRLGIKPLYYYRQDERVAFASEMKAFFGLTAFRPALREEAVAEHLLFTRPPGNKTLLEGVFEVRPGSYVEIGGGEVREHSYYHLSDIPERRNVSEREALEQFDFLLGQSIRRRLVSDVPVGVFLSGGLDSSILSVKTAELVDEPISTISVAYPETSANEFRWSDEVAQKIRSHHHKAVVHADDFFDLFPWTTYMYDGPVTTGAAFYKAAQVAKQHCTVMLCGQGSDELFGGYSRYRYAGLQRALNRAVSRCLPRSGIDLLARWLPRMGERKVFRKVGARLGLSEERVAASYAGGIPQEDFCGLLGAGANGRYEELLAQYAQLFPSHLTTDFINKMLRAEMANGLQGILQQTDRMTMAASVETRVPFLDHELVEFAFSLPSSLKIRKGEGKYLLKKYLARHFSPTFVYRKKMGFPNPIFEWFEDPENPLHRLLNEPADTPMSRLFDKTYVARFSERVRSGRLGRTGDILSPLIALLSFEVWWKTVAAACEGETPAPVS